MLKGGHSAIHQITNFFEMTVIITGANSGIGKETAKALAKMGWRVVMVCRNPQKGEAARQEIIQYSGNQNIDLLIADLSSLSDIKHLADELTSRYDHIDVLINNAGGAFFYKQLSKDGHEMTFAVNYLAVYYLTILTLPLLKAAPQGRIVIVSSMLQGWGNIDWEDIEFKNRQYNILTAYCQSKLMTIIFTKELAKRLQGTNVTVNALHPGGVATKLGMNDNPFIYKLVWKLMSLFSISPQKGAETSIYLASSPDVEGISGKYWSNKKLRKNNPKADKPGVGERLWELSQKMTGV